MKKTIPHLRFILIIAVSALLTSCTKYYGPALHGYEMAYLPKAEYKDSTISTRFGLSGSVHRGNGYNGEDINESFKGNIHVAHAFRLMDVSYGLYAYSGNYHVGDSLLNIDGVTDGTENFSGYGAQIGLNLAYRGKNYTIRYFGVDLALYNESGQYYNFRKRIDALGTNDIYETIGGRNGVSLAFGSEFEVFSEQLQGSFGAKASLGKSMNFSYVDFDGQRSPSYIMNLHAFYKREHFFAVLSIQGNQQGIASLGFGYNF